MWVIHKMARSFQRFIENESLTLAGYTVYMYHPLTVKARLFVQDLTTQQRLFAGSAEQRPSACVESPIISFQDFLPSGCCLPFLLDAEMSGHLMEKNISITRYGKSIRWGSTDDV
jgi:hypothetical protein